MGDREFVESTLFSPHSSFLYVFTGDFLRIVHDVFIPPPFSIRIKFFQVAGLFSPFLQIQRPPPPGKTQRDSLATYTPYFTARETSIFPQENKSWKPLFLWSSTKGRTMLK